MVISEKNKPKSRKSIRRTRQLKTSKKKYKCKICQNNEHRTKNCPRTLCTYCGQMKGHHTNLGNGSLCSNISIATKKVEPEVDMNEYCSKCQITGHALSRCPSIWRIYVPKKKNTIKDSTITPNIPMHTLFCYNCGNKGHYGDECPEEKHKEKMKYQSSAFSGKNLSDTLKNIYYNNLKNMDSSEYASINVRNKNRKMTNFFPPPYKNLRAAEFSNEVSLFD